MQKNVGTTDRIVRVIVGIALLSLIWLLEPQGGIRWIGLLGIVPLATAAVGYCPLYTLLGKGSCPFRR